MRALPFPVVLLLLLIAVAFGAGVIGFASFAIMCALRRPGVSLWRPGTSRLLVQPEHLTPAGRVARLVYLLSTIAGVARRGTRGCGWDVVEAMNA